MLALLVGRLWPGMYWLADARCDIALARLEGLGGAAMLVRVGDAGCPDRDERFNFERPAEGVAGPSSES